MGGSVVVELNREYSAEELGHFRVLAQIFNMHESDPHPALYLAGRDSYPVIHHDGQQVRAFGTLSRAWSRNPDEDIQNTVFSTMQTTASAFECGAHLHKKGPFPTLGSLDQRWLSVYITQPLLGQISGIVLIVNGYMVAGHSAQELTALEHAPLIDWPDDLSEAERLVPWATLMIKNPQPMFELPGADRKGWSLQFDEYTPTKVR
jgi:hypothetical protein